jgi:GntR family transcriptional repressor for pyruvate dehydrogenase complex
MADETIFTPIGTGERLADRVVRQLQGMIVGGTLRPGAKLPAQDELSEQMGVSRTVLREAIRVLAARGLLVATPGVGTFVREVASEQLTGPLHLLLHTTGISLNDLHQVRSILEVEIAGLAAEQITENEISRLNACLATMEFTQSNAEQFADADGGFHHTLAEATGNPLLVLLLTSIRDVMRGVRLAVHRHPGLTAMVMSDHRKILESVEARDTSGARTAMRKHLQDARAIQDEVLMSMKEAPGSDGGSPLGV